MSDLLAINLNSQPEFPRDDLTDTNADLLELMLANTALLEMCHKAGEAARFTFRTTHPAVARASSRIYEYSGRQRAIDYGISGFEAMTALVQGVERADSTVIVQKSGVLAVYAEEGYVRDYLSGAFETFRAELPRATEVIKLASERVCGPLTEYAVLGAAVTRQLELDAIKASQQES